jgi:hypothetical protein
MPRCGYSPGDGAGRVWSGRGEHDDAKERAMKRIPDDTPDAVSDPEIDEVRGAVEDPEHDARAVPEEGVTSDPASFLES